MPAVEARWSLMVQMFIHRVALDPQGRALVFLSDAENRRMLPIWIGLFEARAIVYQMRESKFPRPMTHDLLKSVIEAAGYKVEKVRVTKLEDKTFYATLDLSNDAGTVEVDARPSDAIALALRAEAPIYVAEEVLEEAEIPTEKADEEEMETFRRLMESVAVEDLPMDDEGPIHLDFGPDANTGAGDESQEDQED
jgi:bifunctional DNase/RNase